MERSYGLTVSRLQLIKAAILDTYRVSTNDGPYILRIYPAHRRKIDAITTELDFLEFLYSHGVTVSIPIKTKSGERTLTLQAPEGTRHAAVFTYAPGQPLHDDPEIVRRFGSALARMHAVANAFPRAGTRTPLDVRFLLESPLAHLRTVANRREDWNDLQRIAKIVRSHLEALPAAAPYFGYCHGDVCRANVHVNSAGDIILFDFDFCGPGWRAYDVATFLSGESAPVTSAFFEGYQAIRTLTDREMEAIPLFQIAQSIWMLGTRASYLDEWGTIRFTDHFVDNVLKQIRATLDSCNLEQR